MPTNAIAGILQDCIIATRSDRQTSPIKAAMAWKPQSWQSIYAVMVATSGTYRTPTHTLTPPASDHSFFAVINPSAKGAILA